MFERARSIEMVILVLASLFLGCWQGSTTGPGEIHWDRETCEHCQMVISERRHAVQVRLRNDRQTHAFDDLGCGLLWLDQQESTEAANEQAEVWAKSSDGGDWIDARSAHFEAGLNTPMAYGFGIAEEGFSLAEVRTAVRETEQRRRSRTARPADPTHHHEHSKGEDLD